MTSTHPAGAPAPPTPPSPAHAALRPGAAESPTALPPAAAAPPAALPDAVLPDAEARRRIHEDLDTNFLVEAGAGSGKTTALVGRMLALVKAGVPVEGIAAVTFTRKAAGELARRFREALENEARSATPGGEAMPRLDRALRDVDRAFVGTIHAFCARLLRERPLSARVDPRFTEIAGVEEVRLEEEFWTRWLDELHASEHPILRLLGEIGLAPQELRESFTRLVELSDVDFPSPEVGRPDAGRLRRDLLELVERARRRMPPEPLEGRRDGLQTTVRRLVFLRNTTRSWELDSDLFGALEGLSLSGCDVVQKQWAADAEGKAAAKDLRDGFQAFVQGSVADALRQWHAHRYAVALEFLLPLREAFARDRYATGRLTFGDLLALAARLLREDPEARAELGRRWSRLLVDEFQDTDPLQAEICLLLASDPGEGAGWRTARPRPGALFVVGDPKQSIYRFRRADIEIYGMVRDLIVEAGGEVLELTCNFRSVPAIGAFVDAAFERLLPDAATLEREGRRDQAAFARFNAQRPDVPGDGVFRYCIEPEGGAKDLVGQADARAVASWIAERVASDRKAGDFLVVPYRKEALAFYARELEAREVPVTTTGAGLRVERELRELLVLLEALADPGNQVWTLASLTGLFFGVDPGELWGHRSDGRALTYDRRRFDGTSRVEAALEKLRQWSDLCRDWPVDAALARIVGEIGLLPLAAAEPMGEGRAGSLVHALEIVGVAAAAGATDLRSAIAAIEAVTESPEVEAPLRPGRPDAVRVMNLHKAKGLEAPVVVLPYPTGYQVYEPRQHVTRTGERAMGWFQLSERKGWKERIRAGPLHWKALADEERRFDAAERIRLLYVATTRARDELVVAQCSLTGEKSPWHRLEPELQALAAPLHITIREPGPRPMPDAGPEDVRKAVERATAACEAAGAPAYEVRTVTAEKDLTLAGRWPEPMGDLEAEENAEIAEAKEETGGAESEEGEVAEAREKSGAGEPEEDRGIAQMVFGGSFGRGRDWGTIVHRAIATMGRGRSGDSLRAYCRGLLLQEERRTDGAGEPVELPELMEILARVGASPTWAALTDRGEALWELPLALFRESAAGPPRLTVGTVDALGRGAAGQPTTVVDWKTDAVEPGEWARRLPLYEQQVAAYREMLRVLTGAEVEARVERVG